MFVCPKSDFYPGIDPNHGDGFMWRFLFPALYREKERKKHSRIKRDFLLLPLTSWNDIWTQRLHDFVGLKGQVLNWFSSNLKDRSVHVSTGNFESTERQNLSRFLQVSSLAPSHFILYMLSFCILIKYQYFPSFIWLEHTIVPFFFL